MKLTFVKMAGFVVACVSSFLAAQIPAGAQGLSSGVLTALSTYMDYSTDASVSDVDQTVTKAGQAADETVYGYHNLGIANVETNLNIRKEADETAELTGKLPKDAACEILGVSDGWCEIQSGEVSGYVKQEYLITGDEAKKKAEEIVTTMATVTTATLNVREKQNTDCDIIAQMPEGEELHVLELYDGWAKIELDGEEGYISTDYVTIADQLPTAMTMTEVKYGQGVSDVRVSLVSYATQFVGNPYVWGGTSLTKGADCSGFVMSVFAKYGIYLPRTSSSQSGSGTRISASEAQPGDLFFYGSGRGISHVAIYIGNGQIVHASSPRSGIKISNAYYRNPVKVVRVLN